MVNKNKNNNNSSNSSVFGRRQKHPVMSHQIWSDQQYLHYLDCLDCFVDQHIIIWSEP